MTDRKISQLESWTEQRIKTATTITSSKFKSASSIRAIAVARLALEDQKLSERLFPDALSFMRVAYPNLYAHEAAEIEEIVKEYISNFNALKLNLNDVAFFTPLDLHLFGN